MDYKEKTLVELAQENLNLRLEINRLKQELEIEKNKKKEGK